MKKFVPRWQEAPWPDGLRALHVYACPDLEVDHQLARLVRQCHEAMRDYPITPLDTHLHATIEMVADTSSDRITDRERCALAGALRSHLANAAPIEVRAGSPITNVAGAVLDLSPDEQLVDLTDRVRTALVQARGSEVVRHNGGRHHISLGYAWAEADSDTLQSTLRRISPSHAPFHITKLHLLDVQWRQQPRGDDHAWEISWDHLDTLPLGVR